MSAYTMDDFLNKIESTLKKNGFPDSRVSLPLERMYEFAYEKGLNFNQALEILSQRGISHEKTTEKVIFYTQDEQTSVSAEQPDSPFGGTSPKSMADLIAKAQEMMSKMTPEQQAEIQNRVANMSPQEREAMMAQAKKMGLVP